jgi:hypothetical protein
MSEKYNKNGRDDNGFTPNGKNKYGKISNLLVWKRRPKRNKSNFDSLKTKMKAVKQALFYMDTKVSCYDVYVPDTFINRCINNTTNFSRRRIQDYGYRLVSKQNRIHKEECRLMCQDQDQD